jgi:hypothetical protein
LPCGAYAKLARAVRSGAPLKVGHFFRHARPADQQARKSGLRRFKLSFAIAETEDERKRMMVR